MDKIDNLLNQMTLEEKVSLLAGANFWETVPNQRLGIPALKVTDGPNGARGSIFRDGVKAACFPVGKGQSWSTSWDGDHSHSKYDVYWIPFGY